MVQPCWRLGAPSLSLWLIFMHLILARGINEGVGVGPQVPGPPILRMSPSECNKYSDLYTQITEDLSHWKNGVSAELLDAAMNGTESTRRAQASLTSSFLRLLGLVSGLQFRSRQRTGCRCACLHGVPHLDHAGPLSALPELVLTSFYSTADTHSV